MGPSVLDTPRRRDDRDDPANRRDRKDPYHRRGRSRGAVSTSPCRALVVLLGPSGSDKSTFLDMAGGLDRETGVGSSSPTTPRRGRTTGRSSPSSRPRRLRLPVLQSGADLTARENVALVTEIALDPMRSEAALAAVGLADRLDHSPPALRLRAAAGGDRPGHGGRLVDADPRRRGAYHARRDAYRS